MNWLNLFTVTISGAIALALSHASLAKPLSSKACVELVNEHAKLLKTGIERQMKKDPATAGSTLKPKQLANIDRFLFIEGQIRFRCPEVRLPSQNVPKHSKAQAAEFQKRAKREADARKAEEKKAKKKKPKGPDIPLPDRNPKRQANAAS